MQLCNRLGKRKNNLNFYIIRKTVIISDFNENIEECFLLVADSKFLK